MTVSELMALLSSADPNAVVMIERDDYYLSPVDASHCTFGVAFLVPSSKPDGITGGWRTGPYGKFEIVEENEIVERKPAVIIHAVEVD